MRSDHLLFHTANQPIVDYGPTFRNDCPSRRIANDFCLQRTSKVRDSLRANRNLAVSFPLRAALKL
jgi:hypothetical protein